MIDLSRVAYVHLHRSNMYMVRYHPLMKLTATSFRQKLFSALDAASKGERIEITHKGRTFQLHEETSETWLERIAAKPRLPGISIHGPIESPWDESSWRKKWQARDVR